MLEETTSYLLHYEEKRAVELKRKVTILWLGDGMKPCGWKKIVLQQLVYILAVKTQLKKNLMFIGALKTHRLLLII